MSDFWSGEMYVEDDIKNPPPLWLGPPIRDVNGKPVEGGVSTTVGDPVPISAVVNPDGTVTVGHGIIAADGTIFGLSPLVALGIAAAVAYFVFGKK